ncbi:PKD domain-containing protein [Paraburkholderia hayleyella]|uniref:PKD domain-containing protein n=1 Tax=Paraburkholderia hayleyella TaxID=2152889 RepID=UPI0012923183|nr:M12 family metallo-peptidase [Paraburkholderia hayleyella]
MNYQAARSIGWPDRMIAHLVLFYLWMMQFRNLIKHKTQSGIFLKNSYAVVPAARFKSFGQKKVSGWSLAGTAITIFLAPVPTIAATRFLTLEAPSVQQRMLDQPNHYVEALKESGFEPVLVRVDPSVVNDQNNELEIRLANDKTVVARKQRFATVSTGITAWDGEIQAPQNRRLAGSKSDKEVPVDGNNEVILVRHGANITASIRVGGELYQVMPVGDGQHVIYKRPELTKPHDEVDWVKAPVHTRDNPEILPRNLRNSSHSTIRVMVAITNQVRPRWADIDGLVALAFKEANVTNVNSHVAITFENAGVVHLNYNETGSLFDMLYKMEEPDDPQLGKPVHELREAKRADLVVLLTTYQGGITGVSFTNASKENAFSLVADSMATGTGIFAHEMGHNMGLLHENDGDPNQPLDPGRPPWVVYSHGFQQLQGPNQDHWHTTMAYSCPGGCPGLRYWSNPNLVYGGYAMGTKKYEDAVRRLEERREYVAAFYPPPEQISPPSVIASASPSEVSGSTLVMLDASRSSDASGGALRYEWSQYSGLPALSIDGSDQARAMVRIPAVSKPTVFVFKVVVTNAAGLSAASLPISVEANPSSLPSVVASASPSKVTGSALVMLDASGSSDASGGALSYEWSQYSGLPALSIDGSDQARAMVRIPAVSKFTIFNFKVVVTNAAGLSATSLPVSVEANPAAPRPESCGDVAEWDAKKAYETYGEKVAYKGKIYQQNFYNINLSPDRNSAPFGAPWVYLEDCPGN